ILSESRSALERRKAQHVQHEIRRAEGTARKTLSSERAAATASILVARDRLLERVRSALLARVRESGADPGWLAALGTELRAALDRLPSGDVVVRARPEVASALAPVVEDRPVVRVETSADVGTGF